MLRAEVYFWERRSGKKGAGSSEQRQLQQPGANAVRVAVSDTGPGLHQSTIERIFEDFVRVDRTSSGSRGWG